MTGSMFCAWPEVHSRAFFLTKVVVQNVPLLMTGSSMATGCDWLYAACLEYFIFFSIDSSEARKQYDEYCLSIMQAITYAHDRTHFQGTGWIVPFDLREWN